ncbi:sterol desaturase family protein [Geitlerinema sp. PCC 7407]|uniref:sterol desaturase family protein n=1 Tax=Geitlerinema sp. PCC 7407 TaxID=1173025 RepID=UPI00029FBB3B|nr:sterol desaturase family protein [Geitlerinema sp. PCC 7407]AFY66627.1 fatty acid hydroxylase [Geitlerinema sp. PCC 7407]
MGVFVIFVLLVAWTVARSDGRRSLMVRSPGDWLLDLLGLNVQGLVVPLVQSVLAIQMGRWLWPAAQRTLVLPGAIAFGLSFVVVDYLYYWNHRWLHSPWGWPLHQVHHTLTQVDVLGTSRNTLWSSVFIVYWWIHGLFLYWLADPWAYGLGMTLTAMLDLWRHSGADLPPWLTRILSPWLILPADHARHHTGAIAGNYGANFKLWDRLHGTYQTATPSVPVTSKSSLTLAQKLLWPFPMPFAHPKSYDTP